MATASRDASPAADVDLVLRSLSGDVAAFESLVRRHYTAAFAVALACTCNREDAEDVCQDAFISAASRLSECRDPARFKPWLFAIVRNRAHNVRRAAALRRTDTIDDVAAPPARDDPLRDAELAELRSRLERALATLSVAQREVVLLHDMEGWAHREIGDALDISETMSRQHLFVARRSMRKLLTPSTMETGDDE
jgi:RNA polymerase sigma-70 factor (ECF subfamily)